ATVPTVTLNQINTLNVGVWDERARGLGGWSLSVHHAYDFARKVLHMGTGDRKSAELMSGAVTTVLDVTFQVLVNVDATAFAVGSDGSLYYGSTSGIYRRLVTGQTTQLATLAAIDLTLAPDGNLYFLQTLPGQHAQIGK